jgi:hypothetical protein
MSRPASCRIAGRGGGAKSPRNGFSMCSGTGKRKDSFPAGRVEKAATGKWGNTGIHFVAFSLEIPTFYLYMAANV